MKGKYVKCFNCGKSVYRYPRDLRKSQRFFCSCKCRYIAQKSYQKEINQHLIRKVEKICLYCGKKFIVHKYREDIAKFCSKKCNGLWISENCKGKNSPYWKGGKNRLPKCLICSKRLSTIRAKYCYKHSPKVSGINHSRWIKDRSIVMKNLRNDGAYTQWVKKVKKRDKGICRINNKDCSGYKIVHHILSWSEYPELRYNVNNGITLCQAHHPRKRAEEKRLIPFFNGLVSVSNV